MQTEGKMNLCWPTHKASAVGRTPAARWPCSGLHPSYILRSNPLHLHRTKLKLRQAVKYALSLHPLLPCCSMVHVCVLTQSISFIYYTTVCKVLSATENLLAKTAVNPPTSTDCRAEAKQKRKKKGSWIKDIYTKEIDTECPEADWRLKLAGNHQGDCANRSELVTVNLLRQVEAPNQGKNSCRR